jgi:hypothetical protein
MISTREPIGSRDDIWTRADKGYDMKNDICYDMFIIYFNRENNWFVPKCKLVILARIKYMYIVIEQENYYFNIQIQ